MGFRIRRRKEEEEVRLSPGLFESLDTDLRWCYSLPIIKWTGSESHRGRTNDW